ncbi:MAG: site-specific integrase [Candidatus Micrarchaeota archaeon]
MALGKQAKVLTKQQQDTVLSYLSTTRHGLRNKVIFLLSARAGLRATEIAHLTWNMLTDASGALGNCISLTDSASKGKSGGVVWLNKELKAALDGYRKSLKNVSADDRVIRSERANGSMTAQVIVNMFAIWYKKMGFDGCSSHSGRRTFITNAARKISSVGGSMRDVQALARHSSLSMTQKYIESDVLAQQKVVNLI